MFYFNSFLYISQYIFLLKLFSFLEIKRIFFSMKLSDFLNWLDSYLNFEKQQKKGIFWLESMRFLCGKLGNPQNDVPCIHIVGSKGKGSVSKMIACILNEAGYSCGLYMSPHISDFR